MKIALFAEHYPPTEGGVATSAQRVARSLARRGASVEVFCFDPSGSIDGPDYVLHDVDDGVAVARVGPFFLKQPDLPAHGRDERVRAELRRRAFSQLQRLLDDREVDVILAFYAENAGFLARLMGEELKLPVVVSVRGNDIGRNVFDTSRFAVVQWIVEGAAHVVCVNEHLRRRTLMAFPWAASRLSVIPNSVLAFSPAPPRAEARARVAGATGWDPAGLWVTFIGVPREKKGIAQLATALASLDGDPSARLLIVGPEPSARDRQVCGDAWTRLRAQGRVHSTGLLARDQVASWAAACDVVAMPSLDDGMANGLLEGMTLGLCPLVTTVFDDAVSPAEGIVVPPGDVAALAAALRALAAEPSAVRRLGQAARARTLSFRPDDEAAAYLRVLAASREQAGRVAGR